MSELLTKVKENLILEHSVDDGLIERFITAAVSYAESYQHIEAGYYTENAMPATTEQAVIMLASHFYESRDGSTGGFFADIVITKRIKDSEGFSATADEILASVRVYREGRHGSERWANLAAFSEATDLFRFRCIPGLTVTTDHILVCEDGRFEITSVEDVKGRGMYTEVLAKKVVATSG